LGSAIVQAYPAPGMAEWWLSLRCSAGQMFGIFAILIHDVLSLSIYTCLNCNINTY